MIVNVNELSVIPFTTTGGLSNSFIDGYSVSFYVNELPGKLYT